MDLHTLLEFVPKHHNLKVEPGGTLYINGRDCHVLDGMNARAHTVAILQPGDWVTWNGNVNGLWHRVTVSTEHGGKAGYLLQSSLTDRHIDKDRWMGFGSGESQPCRTCNGYGFYVTSNGPGSIAHIVPCECGCPHPPVRFDYQSSPANGAATKA
jgi:hypothetical protein